MLSCFESVGTETGQKKEREKINEVNVEYIIQCLTYASHAQFNQLLSFVWILLAFHYFSSAATYFPKIASYK